MIGRRGEGLVPYTILGAGLLVWATCAVRLARGLWFFGDDFDFLLNRSVSLSGEQSLLVPHNEHWSTIPILLFRLDYAMFGLHHYLPYAVLPIAMHLVISTLVVVLLRLSGSGPWVAVMSGLVALFIAGGAGAENTLWDFQTGFLGSCLLGLLALVLLAAERGSRGGALSAVALLVLSLMSSGMGVVMVIWAGAFVVARDGVARALLIVAPPAAVYLAWYTTYGHGHSGAPPPDIAVAPIAALRGLDGVWSTATGVSGSGAVVLVTLAAAAVLTRRDVRISALAVSGLASVVAAYALLGYSRSGIGSDATLRSRYVYFGIVLMLPALAAGLAIIGRALVRRRKITSVIAWSTAAAVVAGVGVGQADRWAADRRKFAAVNRDRIVAASHLVESGLPILRTQPMPERNPDVTAAALKRASANAALPQVTPGASAVLVVTGRLMVDVGGVARPFGTPAGVRWRGFERGSLTRTSAPRACETRTSSSGGVLEVPPTTAPFQLRLRIAGTEVRTQLGAGGRRSPAVRWPISPGMPFYVASTARAVTLRIVLPPGAATVCG